MKTIFTPTVNKRLHSGCIVLLLSLQGFAQPDYVFKNALHIAGTDRQIGAQYRFRNVKPGTDGIITITDIRNISLNTLDGGSGYDEAFQPVINVPKKKKGYVEFKLDFVLNNTFTPVVMSEVPLTAIDIDGYIYPDEKIYEFDEFALSPNYYIQYDVVGTALNVMFKAGWVEAINKTAVDYPGVDTVQRDVMFSMVHASVSSVTFRVGADNKSTTDVTRLRSVYFRKFAFAPAVLSQSAISSFSGRMERSHIALNWNLEQAPNLQQCVLERSENGQSFTPLSNYKLAGNGVSGSFSYTDLQAQGKAMRYRLQLVYADGRTAYSQVLSFKNSGTATSKLTVFPNNIQTEASINISSEAAQASSISVVSYSGGVVYQSAIKLNKGANSFPLSVGDRLARGTYVVMVPLNGKMLSEKIMVQ